MQKIDFKRFMFEQKIKQTELAEYLGVSKGYMSLVVSGQRTLTDENFSKLINNPFGWDTSILLGVEKENSEKQPENPMTEQPEEKRMVDTLLFLVESQKKDIETLIQLVKEKDTKIDELLTLAQDKDERIDELLTLAQEKDERIGELLTLTQEKDERIEELLTLTQDRDERIEELLDEINARKRGDATSAARSSSASAI